VPGPCASPVPVPCVPDMPSPASSRGHQGRVRAGSGRAGTPGMPLPRCRSAGSRARGSASSGRGGHCYRSQACKGRRDAPAPAARLRLQPGVEIGRGLCGQALQPVWRTHLVPVAPMLLVPPRRQLPRIRCITNGRSLEGRRAARRSPSKARTTYEPCARAQRTIFRRVLIVSHMDWIPK